VAMREGRQPAIMICRSSNSSSPSARHWIAGNHARQSSYRAAAIALVAILAVLFLFVHPVVYGVCNNSEGPTAGSPDMDATSALLVGFWCESLPALLCMGHWLHPANPTDGSLSCAPAVLTLRC
jgi:hypothetical protein